MSNTDKAICKFDEQLFTELTPEEGVSIQGGATQYFTYTVRRGDTLSEITEDYYNNGSASCYKAVAKYNRIPNPNVIRRGQKIKIPVYLAGCGEVPNWEQGI